MHAYRCLFYTQDSFIKLCITYYTICYAVAPGRLFFHPDRSLLDLFYKFFILFTLPRSKNLPFYWQKNYAVCLWTAFPEDNKMASNNESTPSTMSTTQAVSNDTETISNTAAGNTTKKRPLYRTKSLCGDTASIPDRLPVITNPSYKNALTFNKNTSAYLQALSDTSGTKYSNGTFCYKGLPATLDKLDSISTDENTGTFNLPLLWALYGIILKSFQLTGKLEYGKIITIYFPEFAHKIGKSPNIGKKDITEYTNSIRRFQTVIGIINNGTKSDDILPVIDHVEHDTATHTISFSSPYIVRIIQDIHEAGIRKDQKGRTRLKKDGEPLMLPSHSYIVEMGIVSEKNKKALEIVFVIVALIEQAGNNTPHIRADTIISRCPQLHKSLAGQSAGNKNNLLKRALHPSI